MKGKAMAKAYMFYKVKYQGTIVAQFASSNLAVHFVKSIPNEDFIINYDNRINVWDTAKDGLPTATAIDEKVYKYNEKQDERREAFFAEVEAKRRANA